MENRQYKDIAGNPCSLDWLVRNEPEWAANQIRHRDKLEAENQELRKDKERLDWLEKEQVYVGYDVERCAYGLGYDSAYADTIRGAIDAGMDSANIGIDKTTDTTQHINP